MYFALTLTSMILGLFTLPLGWVMPTFDQLILLVGAGIAGGVAHILMTVSFSHARASVLAPFEYLTLPWAMLTGYIFFAEQPGLWFFVAMPVILTGVFLSVSKKES